jgi:RHS repeat-associated protein
VNSKVAEIDPRGYRTCFEYDALQRLVAVIQPQPGAVSGYDTPATATEADPLDLVTRHYYERGPGNNNNPGGSIFNISGFKPTRTVDPAGWETLFTYDKLYRPTKTEAEFASGQFSVTSTEYNDVGNPLIQVDPNLNETKTTYDALNRPTTVTAAFGTPDAAVTTSSYTSTGLLHRVVVPMDATREQVTDTKYDKAGRPVTVTQPETDDPVPVRPVTETTYDSAGNVLKTKNPLGFEWEYVYDSRGRKLQEIAPAVTNEHGNLEHPVTDWYYDAVGNVVRVVDPLGNAAETVYDAANRPVFLVQPAVEVMLANGTVETLHPITYTGYDAAGQILNVVQGGMGDLDGLPDVESLTLNDVWGALVEARSSAVNTYDALGRLVTTSTPLTESTLGSTGSGNWITVTNGYDQAGNRTDVWDGLNQRTRFQYDGLKRNTATIDALEATTTLGYDAINLRSRTDALGQVTEYDYDARNRPKETDYLSTAPHDADRDHLYDKAGNLLSVTEDGKGGLADVVYTYDRLNRQTSETSVGVTHTYTYDLAGNRLNTAYGGGSTITSTYDALNRLSTMSEGGRATTYGYDLAGRVIRKTLPNGDVTAMRYDALGRTTHLNPYPQGSPLYRYRYWYDLYGNVRKIQEDYPAGGLPARTITNVYDKSNRLLTETVVSGANTVVSTYTYDKANNRSARRRTLNGTLEADDGYAYLPTNALGGYASEMPTHRVFLLAPDANGNRTVKNGIWGGGYWEYTYDFENRLVKVTDALPTPARVYEYTYDYRTRRIVRDESRANGENTRAIFSGGTSVREIEADDTTVEYIRGSDWGGGVGGILYSLRGETPSISHANSRGDIIVRTGPTGQITYQAAYEAFGKHGGTPNSAQSGQNPDRQRANSKDEDPTGLLNEGHRYRDLDTGTFITKDPAGFVDGPNLYTYVNQNPWSKFDPLGLQGDELVGQDDASLRGVASQHGNLNNRISPAQQRIVGRVGKRGFTPTLPSTQKNDRRLSQVSIRYEKHREDLESDPNFIKGGKAEQDIDREAHYRAAADQMKSEADSASPGGTTAKEVADQQLADYRGMLGKLPAGSEGDDSTAAKLTINGQNFFGTNGRRQQRQLEKVNVNTVDHAEGDAADAALKAGATGAKSAVMYVDRSPCKSCGDYGGLRSIARNLKVDELRVYSPDFPEGQIFTPTP